jgi:hypothetical protein
MRGPLSMLRRILQDIKEAELRARCQRMYPAGCEMFERGVVDILENRSALKFRPVSGGHLF